MAYEIVKGATALAAIAGLVVIGLRAEDLHIDGTLLYTIVVLVGGLGGIYISDVYRKLKGG